MRNPELHKKKLLIALEKSLGIVTHACKEVGISRNQFHVYYREDEEFRKAVDDINEITLDFVENELFKKIKQGSEKAITFYMRYKARKRGYTDELNIKGEIDHRVTVIRLNGPSDEEKK